jgi:hypothetical protein
MFHTHLSSEAGTIRQLVADEPKWTVSPHFTKQKKKRLGEIGGWVVDETGSGFHQMARFNISGVDLSGDRLCGLVVKVPDYRFRGPSSIPGATRFFSEK